MENLAYLHQLAKHFPTAKAVDEEIARLKKIYYRPRTTEHFMSDIHGEDGAFVHLLRSASGKVRLLMDSLFCSYHSEERIRSFTAQIYYPEEKLAIAKNSGENLDEWYKTTISNLVSAYSAALTRYLPETINSYMPADIAQLMTKAFAPGDTDEMLVVSDLAQDIISRGIQDKFIISVSQAIQKICFDHLHIVGDVYDRGPRPDIIMDELAKLPSLDIQWGNHDIAWMGAAAGSEICVANAVRIALRYNCFDMLLLGYGISLDELKEFAEATYNDDGFDDYKPSCSYKTITEPVDPHLCARMHKAIALIQFKLEGQLAMRNPSLGFDHRMRLEKVFTERGVFEVDGIEYELRSSDFPTVDFKNPYELTEQESKIIKNLTVAFRNNEKLRKHMDILFEKGSVYLCYNGNLLFHGCVPLTEDGEFASVRLFGKTLSGKEYFDFCDEMTRKAYYLDDSSPEKQDALDFMWYMWCGDKSPMFGKHRMTTFERYYTKEDAPRKEIKNAYFKLLDDEKIAEKILTEFGLDPNVGRIINGHVPVKFLTKGEKPIKAGGKLFVIDGGIAKSYQKDTGVAGFTLSFDG
ncbi:MAG: fructose-bisphosphatase class III, partial [Clostridia bacterium]|nr:fructose-bisphosphatase class III [Clostridia bacterium]